MSENKDSVSNVSFPEPEVIVFEKKIFTQKIYDDIFLIYL